MDKPVVIIHFKPLELFPPVMNLVKFLSGTHRGKIMVYTTKFSRSDIPLFEAAESNVIIKRLAVAGMDMASFKRYIEYIKFYIRCFLGLLVVRPCRILYFETLSAYPAYLYRRFVNSKAAILVHYHEYASLAEYSSGMKLARYFHNKERWLYPRVNWLSHTNEDRLQRFMADEGLQKTAVFHTLPNYPPADWQKDEYKHPTSLRRMVYVGAVSRETMYFEEVVDWVLKQEGRFSLDIFTHNLSAADKTWLQQLDSSLVKLHPGVDYYSLPGVLAGYDIGLILYKGHIPNYIINAPNKLFEYLACGLDVWAAVEITGCKAYYTEGIYPKVIPVNFRHLDSFNWQEAVSRNDLRYKRSDFNYQAVYPAVADALFPPYMPQVQQQ